MKDIISYSDEELMQEIKADNMFAFDMLYKKYSRRLYKFGFSIIKSQEETENLIQDVFLICGRIDQTHKRIWLDRATEAANQFITWMISYDYIFPSNSTLGKL